MSMIDGTRIEVIRPLTTTQRRVAVFDFDGTLSLIREGWPEVMIPMMVGYLSEAPHAESRPELEKCVEEFVMRLNGKQTIYQMIQLAEEIRVRGGQPLDPLEYKREYHTRLLRRIEHRIAGLRSGNLDAETLTVPGSRELLQALSAAGLPLVLASGTDVEYVRSELAALQLDTFFQGRIHGAVDNYTSFSKKMVIEQLVKEMSLLPGELIAFGDGFVEIEETHRVQGVAVGVASDEQHRTGINEWKRQRLIGAGADLIVPDYRDLSALLRLLGVATT